MGAWAYCWSCAQALDQITIEEIAIGYRAIPCDHCGKDRHDDSPEERQRVIAQAIVDLKEKLSQS